ncbi:MAG: PDZ domain-containing protein [Terriglobia bacterium]
MRVERAGKLIGLATLLLVVAVIGAATQEAEEWFERDCSFGLCGFGPVSTQVFVSGRGAWLGVRLADVTPEKMAELKLRAQYGAIVAEVEEDSPAAKAGLQENDVILEYQGERVESAATLARLVRETPAGRTVQLRVSRDGRAQTLTATVERRHYARADVRIPRIRIPEIDVRIFRSRPRLGISANELTPQLADYFGVKQGKGVLVREVDPGSAAEKAGLKAGDVIVRVDDGTIEDVGDLRRTLRRKRESKEVTLTIVRDRREQTLKVELGEPRRSGPRRAAEAEVYWEPGLWEDHTAARETAAKQWRQQMERWEQNYQQQWREALESDMYREQMHSLEQQLRRLKYELEAAQII